MTPEELRTLDIESLLTLRRNIDQLLTEQRQRLEQILQKIEDEFAPGRSRPPAEMKVIDPRQRRLSPPFRNKRKLGSR